MARSPIVSRQEKNASGGKCWSQMSRAAAKSLSRYSEKLFFSASMDTSMSMREWVDLVDVVGVNPTPWVGVASREGALEKNDIQHVQLCVYSDTVTTIQCLRWLYISR